LSSSHTIPILGQRVYPGAQPLSVYPSNPETDA
jgi:hypothetical protein